MLVLSDFLSSGFSYLAAAGTMLKISTPRLVKRKRNVLVRWNGCLSVLEGVDSVSPNLILY
jgi:hypothetical protein